MIRLKKLACSPISLRLPLFLFVSFLILLIHLLYNVYLDQKPLEPHVICCVDYMIFKTLFTKLQAKIRFYDQSVPYQNTLKVN